jgi:stage V sporulation protein G
MKITEIQILPIKANNGLVAFANCVLDGNIYLGSIGVHKKLDGSGYRITYPTKKVADKDFHIFHPINKQASKEIEEAIISKTKEIIGEI